MASAAEETPLTDRQNRRIARKQFQPLPEKWIENISQIRTAKQGINTKHVQLPDEDIQTVLDLVTSKRTGKQTHASLAEQVVAQYLQCVCRYRNENDTTERKKGGVSCATLAFMEYMVPNDPEPQPQEWLDEMQAELEKQNAAGEMMLELDYLLIPVHFSPGGGHWAALGVAPKQEAVFLIDSALVADDEEDWYQRGAWPTRELLALLLQNLPEGPQREWPIYLQWALQWPEDGSPPCKRQGDLYNCGVYAATNAMCLAFGYDIMCIKSKYMDDGKRPRILAELANDGFQPPFNYQLLPIPDEMKRTWLTDANNRYYKDDQGERFSDSDSEEELDTTVDSAIVKLKKEKKVKRMEEDWHPQFSPRMFRRKSILWPVKNPKFDKLATKMALKRACRAYGIKGFTWWSKLEVGLFRAWMENVIAGREADALKLRGNNGEGKEKKSKKKEGRVLRPRKQRKL